MAFIPHTTVQSTVLVSFMFCMPVCISICNSTNNTRNKLISSGALSWWTPGRGSSSMDLFHFPFMFVKDNATMSIRKRPNWTWVQSLTNYRPSECCAENALINGNWGMTSIILVLHACPDCSVGILCCGQMKGHPLRPFILVVAPKFLAKMMWNDRAHMRSPPEELHLASGVTFLGDFTCLSWAFITCNWAKF